MYHKPLAYGIRAPELKRIAEKQASLTVHDVHTIMEDILTDTYHLVMKDLIIWINHKVPKMTGRLRKDILNHLKDSYVRNHVLRIFIQTSIDYAERVNEFETKNVRHFGKRIRYRGKTIILKDSRAIGHFFDEMVKFTIKDINFHLVKVKRKYAARTRLRVTDMRIIQLW